MRVWVGVLGLAGTLSAAVVLSAGGLRLPLGLDLYRPVPEANPLTREKATLGRRLFHDRRLSRDGSMACATCHDPTRAFADNRPVAIGVGGAVGRRNVPSIVNRAWGLSFFWDGRVTTLEQQALHPIFNPLELGARADAVVGLARSFPYRRDFVRAFGVEPDIDHVALAIATYVRTILSGDSPYDRFALGQPSALAPSARRGLTLFLGRAGCASCHSGPTFTDERFHNTGVAWQSDRFSDLGHFVISGRDEDRGAFKTPTLREVVRTAPYMHDGSVGTLDEVVEFYDNGGRLNPGLDPRLRPLGLSSDDKRDLVALLRSLRGRVIDGG